MNCNCSFVDVCFICCNFVVNDVLFVVVVEVFVVVARPQLQERIIYRWLAFLYVFLSRII